jgi:hypothetical protein
MSQIKLTTVAADVTLSTLGITFTHPTIDAILYDTTNPSNGLFTIEEVSHAPVITELAAAITGGTITLEDEGNIAIPAGEVQNQVENDLPAPIVSVNGETRTVILDADDISDAATTNKFTNASDISKLGGIESGATADQSAAEVPYTNTTSLLTATNVQAAVDEIDGTVDTLNAASHTQNSDTALDSGNANEVTAADLRAHVDSTANPHAVTKTQVGLSNVDNVQQIPLTQKGAVNGVAELDASGLVPTAQLPSFVDDVLEFANLAGFPVTGETGKIYVALDTNKVYRWSGSVYIEIADVGAEWGGITGTLSNQTDLQSALDGKSNTGHTHTASEVTDFDTEVSNNTSVAANTLKVSADGSVDTHSDVNTTGKIDGQYLTWNNAAGQWQPTTLPTQPSKSVSGLLSISQAGQQVFAHGLSASPDLVEIILVCNTNDQQYVAGDEVVYSPSNGNSGNNADKGVSILRDVTNVTIRYGDSGSVFRILDKTSGIAVPLNNARWDIKVVAINIA